MKNNLSRVSDTRLTSQVGAVDTKGVLIPNRQLVPEKNPPFF